MSTETQAEIPSISLVLDALYPAHPHGIADTNLFYKISINGTSASNKVTTVPPTSSIPDISGLKLDNSGNRLSLNDTISRGSLGTVHHASFEGAHDGARSVSAFPSVPLVIKLVVGEDKLVLLRHEAIIYQYVTRLQGSVLPRNYGYYEDEKQKAAFLLLEDCGKPYGQTFEAFSDESKLALMRALKKLHDAGIEHGDLEPWNILNHQESPRIVDWHLAMVHGCPAMDQIMTEEFCCREGISELACEELVSIGERMMFRSQDEILFG